MSNFYIEHRQLDGSRSLSWDLARHIFTRYMNGTIVVASNRPLAFLSSVSRQWHQVVRQVHHERASTLRSEHIYQLAHASTNMQRLPMILNRNEQTLPADKTDWGVFFTSIEQAVLSPPACQTLYIVTSVTDTEFGQITHQMPHHSLVVIYKEKP